jgi:hypothetical protein
MSFIYKYLHFIFFLTFPRGLVVYGTELSFIRQGVAIYCGGRIRYAQYSVPNCSVTQEPAKSSWCVTIHGKV